MPTTDVPRSASRLDSVDLLRGLIMVIMALDHTREYFTAGTASTRDVHAPALFLTRWITHFCASNFVFLAGVGAFLFVARGRALRSGSLFLLTRGLWLILLELTVIRFGWGFSLWPDLILLQVIWAIGWSMIVLSALVFLPRPLLGSFALVLIACHNLLDPIQPAAFGSFGWIWNLLHKTTLFSLPGGIRVLALYPLVPWIGVLAAGYTLGPIFLWPPERRRRALWRTGTAVLVVFVILRASGLYGDPAPFRGKETWMASILAFLDCEKYPPSLLFLCMTIGPALIALAAFEHVRGRAAQVFVVFGRVPLFYYLAHLYLIHGLAVGWALLKHQNPQWLFHGLPPMANPPGWDMSLPAVYGMWALVVGLLFGPCVWYARLKQRRRDWWLSYL